MGAYCGCSDETDKPAKTVAEKLRTQLRESDADHSLRPLCTPLEKGIYLAIQRFRSKPKEMAEELPSKLESHPNLTGKAKAVLTDFQKALTAKAMVDLFCVTDGLIRVCSRACEGMKNLNDLEAEVKGLYKTDLNVHIGEFEAYVFSQIEDDDEPIDVVSVLVANFFGIGKKFHPLIDGRYKKIGVKERTFGGKKVVMIVASEEDDTESQVAPEEKFNDALSAGQKRIQGKKEEVKAGNPKSSNELPKRLNI
jgi:hypothetical protein